MSKAAGERLHQAIAQNDLETCRQILSCPITGPSAAVHKNFRGSTPLMLAADGKCSDKGSSSSLSLVELLLEAGAASSAAQKSRNGRTAANIAMARAVQPKQNINKNTALLKLAEHLRSLEQHAADTETFARCLHCQGKLRKRSKLAFLGDRVRRQEEDNALVLSLFHWNGNNTVLKIMESLERMEFHRVNSCKNFRKEITESMALLEEVRRLRNSMTRKEDVTTTTVIHDDDDNNTNWNDWHFIDLCSGSACVTGALLLHLMPGCFVTAVDIVGRDSLPHFSQAGFGSDGDNSNDNDNNNNSSSGSQFSYVQCDIHLQGLVEQLRNRVELCTASNTTPPATAAASSRSKVHVVVLAMHCCGTLSLRALDIGHALDADATFLMPCCLPPKTEISIPLLNLDKLSTRIAEEAADGTSTQTDTIQHTTNSNKEEETDTVTTHATNYSTNNESSALTGIEEDAGCATTTNYLDLQWRGIEEEVAHIYTSRDQDEQHRRWSMLLRRYAYQKIGDRTTGEVETTMKDIQAVLSARRTSISVFRRRCNNRAIIS